MNTRSRNGPSVKRDVDGRFKKKCGSLVHESVPEEGNEKEMFIDLNRRKKLKVIPTTYY